MRSAIDTNVFSSLWSAKSRAAAMSTLLGDARNSGSIVICAPVYAELSAHRKAAHHFADYAEKRRRSNGSTVRRLLVDFIVGAHASKSADQLIRLDSSRYALDFPNLKIIP